MQIGNAWAARPTAAFAVPRRAGERLRRAWPSRKVCLARRLISQGSLSDFIQLQKLRQVKPQANGPGVWLATEDVATFAACDFWNCLLREHQHDGIQGL